MKSPAYNICEIIVAAGLATLGTDLFYSDLPATVTGNIAGVFDTGGYPQAGNLEIDLFRPTVMIKVKGKRGDYDGAYSFMYSLLGSVNGARSTTTTDANIILVRPISDILFIGYDDDNRPEFTLNLELMRTPNS